MMIVSKTKRMLCLAGVLFLLAWSNDQHKAIEKAGWLTGTWENKTPRGSIYETWITESNNTMLGKSYAIRENDTMVFEHIKLVQEVDGVYYIPVVKNQNEGLPVRFKAKEITSKTLVFENTEHDFPQVIAYTKISPDSLVAEIYGTKNGQGRSQTFPMVRVK